jgi:uncharacterized protein
VRATLRFMDRPSSPRIWTLTDERAGNFHQADALAAAMGGAAHHVRLRFPAPWRWTSPRGVPGALARLPLPEEAGWPDIAIGCGRQSALALRALKRGANGSVFTVQILDPRIDPAEFDVVITPAHDALRGGNVLSTIGALNAVNAAWLHTARQSMPLIAQLDRPLTSVMIGGPHRDAPLDPDSIAALAEKLRALRRREGGSILLCGSRRTPAPWQPQLRALGQSLDARVWIDARDGANPYRAALACSDRIVVTADSVNMLSEACAVGVSVVSFALAPPQGKLGLFDAALRQRQLLSDWSDPAAPRPGLNETAETAQRVLQLWRDSGRG